MKKFLLLFTAFFSFTLQADDALATRAGERLEAQPESRVIAGNDGWLFLSNELRHLAKGTEWINPAIYPEGLPGDPITEIQFPAPFVAQLKKEDFHVVDLQTLFAAAKHDVQLYCKTDTHWSPRGAEIAAEAVAALLKELKIVDDLYLDLIEAAPPADLTFQGYLTQSGDPTETLPIRRVQRSGGESIFQDSSPILLLGDSHTYVFSDGGDMHARDSGFPEHLALHLFTSRELTESLNGWRELPIAPRFMIYRVLVHSFGFLN